MRSPIAALRTLTLPYGTRTGTRIILDGVNGQILLYNAADELVASLVPEDIPGGGPEFKVISPDGARAGLYADANFALLFLFPNDVPGETWTEGQVYADVFGGQPYTSINSPQGGAEFSALYLFGSAAGVPSSRAEIRATGDFLVNTGSLTAPSPTTIGGLRPQLELAYQETATDSATFTAATTVDSITVPVVSGRKYDVIWDGQFGSSIAGDTIQVTLTDVTGGTTLRRIRQTLDRAIDPWPTHLRGARVTAPATGNRQFAVSAIRAAGTGNITRYGTTANGGPACFQVLEAA